ncbi:hypothetical protein JCM33374_g5533 [Metschnikowia sp. JCM 33374]|nr:hypothetical protein JCM33374_g5533 [Metschnikowia sp. JCM 33374]
MEKKDPKKSKGCHSVLGTIAGKIASTSHLVRHKTEKINTRVQEHWRKPTHTPTKTVDEEFEDLVEELDAITEACQEIIKLNKHFISTYTEVAQSSQRVANYIQLLSTPGTAEAHTEVQADGIKTLSERTRSYSATMVEIGICLKESLLSIPHHIDERIRVLLSYSEKIHERVALRDKALSLFDRVYDKFDSMTILKTTNEFTAKQNQEYNSLEKKLAQLRRSYDNHNTLLKQELPRFFMLVRSFIEPVIQFLFFVQLTAAYQTHSNLLSIPKTSDENNLSPRTNLPVYNSNTSPSSSKMHHDDMSVVQHGNFQLFQMKKQRNAESPLYKSEKM